MGILIFVLGSVFGAVVQFVLETPFEEFVEKRFQQILHTGVYKKLYFKTVTYELLKKRLVHALGEYDFKYANVLLDQMEWFIDEKTREEQRVAREDAQKDYHKDLAIIQKEKGKAKDRVYKESKNVWVTKGKRGEVQRKAS